MSQAPDGQFELKTVTRAPAASGRAKCRACNELVAKGAERVSVRLARCMYGRWFSSVQHFHSACWSEDLGVWPASKPSTAAEAARMFAGAAREAVKTQVAEFRDQHDFASGLFCPLSGEPLTAGNCHVHHAFPSSFKALAVEFVKQHGVLLMQVKYALGRFADEVLARRWAEFHKQRARLMVVHRGANQGLLKYQAFEKLGFCDHCTWPDQLSWVPEFCLALCHDCYRYRCFVSQREAQLVYGLRLPDLRDLKFMRRRNPISGNFALMRLFLATKVRSRAVERHGTAAAILERHAKADAAQAAKAEQSRAYCARLRRHTELQPVRGRRTNRVRQGHLLGPLTVTSQEDHLLS